MICVGINKVTVGNARCSQVVVSRDGQLVWKAQGAGFVFEQKQAAFICCCLLTLAVYTWIIANK